MKHIYSKYKSDKICWRKLWSSHIVWPKLFLYSEMLLIVYRIFSNRKCAQEYPLCAFYSRAASIYFSKTTVFWSHCIAFSNPNWNTTQKSAPSVYSIFQKFPTPSPFILTAPFYLAPKSMFELIELKRCYFVSNRNRIRNNWFKFFFVHFFYRL